MNLAAQLAAARGGATAAESALVDLIYQLFPDWQLLFPVRRSWLWTPPAALDVWGANPTEDAVRALLAAGFTDGVTIHNHRAERFLSCTCQRWTHKRSVDQRTL